MSTQGYRDLAVRAKTQQVVDHHYDDEKPGKPLYLLVPGGLIALASLALVIYIAYQTWYTGEMPADKGQTLMLILAPIYIGGVFLFSYGYELYDIPKALRLTAIVVFITLAAVVIVAVLFVVFSAKGDSGRSRSSSSSSSSSSTSSPTPSSPSTSSSSGSRLSSWAAAGPIFVNTGGPGHTVTREVTHEVVREVPAAPQPVNCPYCGHAYVPAETNYACPNCGAATPQDLLPQGGNP